MRLPALLVRNASKMPNVLGLILMAKMRSNAEHLAAFKAENNVGPNDALHAVRIIFAGPR
jgi:hypothetical protein